MRIALIGYGKMGKIIEEIAISRGHSITQKSTSLNPIEQLDFSIVDIAIEFTTPHHAVKHIEYCIDKNVPVVVGTTAWNDQMNYVQDYVTKNDGALLHASNFSIGVNIFFNINKKLAALMEPNTNYSIDIQETHHIQKVDAPSGTAISLANDILKENKHITSWIHNENTIPTTANGQIPIVSHREENVPGTHIINYNSEIDSIQIKHTAHNRKGFAMGAVIAAEWLINKKGVYTMQDVINI